jgi:hypothetical protein
MLAGRACVGVQDSPGRCLRSIRSRFGYIVDTLGHRAAKTHPLSFNIASRSEAEGDRHPNRGIEILELMLALLTLIERHHGGTES